MTAMTTTALPASAWTAIYTASGAVTITLQNQTPASAIRVRIDPSASIGDALTAAADIMQPFEVRSLTLATGDKVFGCPVQATPGSVNVRA